MADDEDRGEHTRKTRKNHDDETAFQIGRGRGVISDNPLKDKLAPTKPHEPGRNEIQRRERQLLAQQQASLVGEKIQGMQGRLAEAAAIKRYFQNNAYEAAKEDGVAGMASLLWICEYVTEEELIEYSEEKIREKFLQRCPE